MRGGCVLAGSFATALVLAIAEAAMAATVSPACGAPIEVWAPLPAEFRIESHPGDEDGWTIVAVGSSSTAGVGASAPELAYPAQLERMLRSRLPGRRIAVVNKGVGGDTVASNLARLDRDVIALRPDLVIWQVGTNDALREVPADAVRRGIVAGVLRLRSAGAQVVLMDPQPLEPPPARLAVMTEAVRAAAHESGVPVLPRGELMRYWIASGHLAAVDLIGADRLHMTDTGYRCLAERVAELLVGAGEAPPGPSAELSGPAVEP